MRDLTRTLSRRLRITVFCGAACPAPDHLQNAATLGRLLAEREIHLVYGGARIGLMGALADAALGAGGHVTGILPRFLHTPQIAHRALTELEIVPDMNTRKMRLMDLADAIVVLPGGLGTLDEVACVWANAAHGAYTKPLGILNTGSFYGPLLAFVRDAAAAGYLGLYPGLRLDDLVLADDDPERLLDTVISRAHRNLSPQAAAT